jgi:hypothetical protein
MRTLTAIGAFPVPRRRRRITMRSFVRYMPIAAVTAFACSSKSGAPTEVKVDDLGVAITVQTDATVGKRGDDVTVGGVILRRDDAKVANAADAKARLMSDAKVRDQKQLPTGGFLFVYDVEFPMGGGQPPSVLPYVTVILPVHDHAVRCELQLQPGQDPAPTIATCSSLRAL